ncbi:hypothetical protein N234_21685 [Ralstonia pickettii DTP0602]|nr:hypothetical protein N234_21685 [Ralstonia pickettii DTP0602]
MPVWWGGCCAACMAEAIFHGIGWAVLRVVTLGRYPQRARDVNEWLSEADLIALVGVVAVVAVVVAFLWWGR